MLNITLKDVAPSVAVRGYKTRAVAEYWEAKLRYDKVHFLVTSYHAGKLKFNPATPIKVLEKEDQILSEYISVLEERAKFEQIDLSQNRLAGYKPAKKEGPVDQTKTETNEPSADPVTAKPADRYYGVAPDTGNAVTFTPTGFVPNIKPNDIIPILDVQNSVPAYTAAPVVNLVSEKKAD